MRRETARKKCLEGISRASIKDFKFQYIFSYLILNRFLEKVSLNTRCLLGKFSNSCIAVGFQTDLYAYLNAGLRPSRVATTLGLSWLPPVIHHILFSPSSTSFPSLLWISPLYLLRLLLILFLLLLLLLLLPLLHRLLLLSLFHTSSFLSASVPHGRGELGPDLPFLF